LLPHEAGKNHKRWSTLGSSRAHQDLADPLPLLLLHKPLSVLKMAAGNVINADLQQVEHILMLKLLELKVYQSRLMK
jgi:hypothetical protein